jgi:hypothetical protein
MKETTSQTRTPQKHEDGNRRNDKISEGVQHRVSKEVEDGRLRLDGPKVVEGYGMAGPDETLGSSWPPIAICPWE